MRPPAACAGSPGPPASRPPGRIRTCSATRLSPPCWMLALICAMSRSPLVTPARAPRGGMTGPARTWTATRTTSSPPSWPPAPDRNLHLPWPGSRETSGIADERVGAVPRSLAPSTPVLRWWRQEASHDELRPHVPVRDHALGALCDGGGGEYRRAAGSRGERAVPPLGRALDLGCGRGTGCADG